MLKILWERTAILLEILNKAYRDLAASVEAARGQMDAILLASSLIEGSLTKGGTVYLCGNGGSAAEAQHFAAEFVGRFLMERPGLPAVSLTADTSKLTAIGNDYGFENIFSRQLLALAKRGDVLWALSTSGTSPNIIKALELSREIGVKSIFLCGRELEDPNIADISIFSPAPNTPRIQELHLFYGHLICDLVDRRIFALQEGEDGSDGSGKDPGVGVKGERKL